MNNLFGWALMIEDRILFDLGDRRMLMLWKQKFILYDQACMITAWSASMQARYRSWLIKVPSIRHSTALD